MGPESDGKMNFPLPSGLTPPTWLLAATVPRLILLLNHVISTEEVAMSRLRPHAGRRVRLESQGPQGWPSMPPLVVEITPAGLLEWSEKLQDESFDLQVVLDASQPLMLLTDGLRGQRPKVLVSGDATLAADISWLFENLRWDLEDDLAMMLGPVVAREVVRWGGWLGAGLRQAAQQVSTLADRWGSGSPAA